MMASDPAAGPPAFSRNARQDVRFWQMLAVGIVFLYAGLTVEPSTNCAEGGRECAPWLVPVAGVIGAMATLAASATLLANPRRGSRIDPLTGDLIWWQQRTRGNPGYHGRIHPSRIGSVRIVRGDSDTVSLCDLSGERLPWFDGEVIPWPHDRWAGALLERWPHIRLDIE